MFQHTTREEKTTNARRRYARDLGYEPDHVRRMITREHSWLGCRYESARPDTWTLDREASDYADARPLSHNRDGSRFRKAERRASAIAARKAASWGLTYPILSGHRRFSAIALLLRHAV